MQAYYKNNYAIIGNQVHQLIINDWSSMIVSHPQYNNLQVHRCVLILILRCNFILHRIENVA